MADTLGSVFHIQRAAVADRNRGFYDHHGFRIDLKYQVDNILDAMCVEIVLHRIVVGRSGDYHEIGIAIGPGPIKRCGQVELLLGKIFLDIIVLNGRYAVVDLFNFFGNDIDSRHVVVLGQKSGYRHAYVAGAGNCYIHIVSITDWDQGLYGL